MHDFELLKGLKALSDSTFPKKCSSCGKVYETFEQFVTETERLRGTTGLMEGIGEEEDEVVVEVYRNCTCGSTLMDFFSDRRDTSEKGIKRRQLFDKVMNQLISQGVTPEIARQELLNILHGEKSEMLESFGVKVK